MWHCGTLLCGRQRRTSKHRENEGIFHISSFKLEALLINEGETTRGERESGRNDSRGERDSG